MLQGLYSLTVVDIFFAAVAAFVITHLINRFLRFQKILMGKNSSGMDYSGINESVVMKKCSDMFPIETIYFRGKVFSKGMRVRITTLQKKIIEGELIGKNDMDILCVITGKHIIAHEINKIEDMTDISV